MGVLYRCTATAEEGRMPRFASTIKSRLSVKGAAIVLGIGLLATTAAYGASGGFTGSAGHQHDHGQIAFAAAAKKRVPRPRITAHPEAETTSTTATFHLSDAPQQVKLRCRLDLAVWRGCGRTITYESVATGAHRFSARAIRPGARPSRVVSFSWTVEAPVIAVTPIGPSGPSFEIAQSGPPPLLYPGAGPSPLPVTLSNPNPDPIQVTSLSAAIRAAPVGCDPRENVRVEPSPVSSADPLVVAAGGTLEVTAPQAPTIELVENGTNQDACRSGSFSLNFTGSAQG
jgi:hypothetical protein